MDEAKLTLALVVGAGIGALIGIERERGNQRGAGHFAGFRSFILIGMLGALTAGLTPTALPVAVAISLGVVALAVAAYVVEARDGQAGVTTEIALLLTFCLGMLAYSGSHLVAIGSAVAIATILSLKVPMHSFAGKLSEDELHAIFKLTVAVALLLPLLPTTAVDTQQVLIPRQVGITVVLVLVLNFLGYFLGKFWGVKRTIVATGLLGGLVSSTAVTWTLAGRSARDSSRSGPCAFGTMLAILVMIPRVITLSYLVNPTFAWHLAIRLSPLVLSGALAIWLLRPPSNESKDESEVPVGNPLEIIEAVKFGVLFVAILYGVHYARQWFGDSGVYLASAIAGVADLDAITLSLAQSPEGRLPLSLTVGAILLAVNVNNLVKLLIAITRGSALYRSLMLRALGGMVAVGVGVQFLL